MKNELSVYDNFTVLKNDELFEVEGGNPAAALILVAKGVAVVGGVGVGIFVVAVAAGVVYELVTG